MFICVCVCVYMMHVFLCMHACNVAHVFVVVWFDALNSHDTDTSDRHRKSEYWDSKDKHPWELFSLPTAQSKHLTVFPFLSRCWRAYWCFLVFANQGKRKSEKMEGKMLLPTCIYILFLFLYICSISCI